MSRIFVSLSAIGEKHFKLENNFQKFFHEVLRLKDKEFVFSSSMKSKTSAGIVYSDDVVEAMNSSDFFVFLITEEFTLDWSCGFKIGVACINAGLEECYPLLGSNVNPDYLSATPFAGFEPQYYKDPGALEKLGSTLCSAGITSRSPKNFSIDFKNFCTITHWW